MSRTLFRRAPWFMMGLGLLLWTGCSDDDGPKPDLAADLGPGTDLAPDTAPPADSAADVAADAANLIGFGGVIYDDSTKARDPVAGARVCLLPDKTTCETTDKGGAFTLFVPRDLEIAMEVSATGYLPRIFQFTSLDFTSKWTWSISILPTSETTAYFTSIGVTLDSAKGLGYMKAVSSPLGGAAGVADATFTWSPATGSDVVYDDIRGKPQKALTATTLDGHASLANIPPGDYVVTATHPKLSCGVPLGLGWSGTAKHSAKMGIYAGHGTGVTFVCE